MSRFTNKVKLRIKQYVLDATIQRLSPDETIDYVESKIHERVSKRHIEYLKTVIKRQSRDEFEKLRSDGLSYRIAFMDRIDEIRNLQRKQWDLYNEYKSPFLRLRVLTELRSLTETMTNLYDLLPAVDSLFNVRTEPKESAISGESKEDSNRVY